MVERERQTIAKRLEALRLQSDRLRAVMEAVDRDVEATARILRGIDEILGIAPQLSLDALSSEVRGQKLRELAIEILRKQKGRGVVIHYRDWYALVVQSGVRVGGKDPVAAFLTQVSRADGVESVRPRSGLYRLATV